MLADRWWLRLRGLLGRRALAPGEGLLLVPCKSVHTFGMRLVIDVAFLDPSGRVVAVYLHMSPGRVSRVHADAQSALELPSGVLASSGTIVGDVITIT
jgi:uncharacterized membrane protein (UPF0127 family)